MSLVWQPLSIQGNLRIRENHIGCIVKTRGRQFIFLTGGKKYSKVYEYYYRDQNSQTEVIDLDIKLFYRIAQSPPIPNITSFDCYRFENQTIIGFLGNKNNKKSSVSMCKLNLNTMKDKEEINWEVKDVDYKYFPNYKKFHFLTENQMITFIKYEKNQLALTLIVEKFDGILEYEIIKPEGEVPNHLIEFSSIIVGRKLILFGGKYDIDYSANSDQITSKCTNNMWEFSIPLLMDKKQLCWRRVMNRKSSGNIPPPCFGHQLVKIQNYLFLIGGKTEQGTTLSPQGNLYVFDLYEKYWIEILSELNMKLIVDRINHISFPSLCSEFIYVHGGQSISSADNSNAEQCLIS